jgi:lysyl-tRNA synthetase class 2
MRIEDLKARQALQNHIHHFFQTRDYMLIDAPIMVVQPGTEVHLDYFTTEWRDHRGRDRRLFLRSSPELHLKQAMSWGLPRVYHLGKCFRNHGEISEWHHPEFSMLEYYQTGIDLQAFMGLAEDLVRTSAEVLGSKAIPKVFAKLSVFEAFESWAGIVLIDQDPELARKARRAHISPSIRDEDDFETAYFKILIDVIEPCLAREGAIFLYDYPVSQAALANIKDGRAQRFELYINGVELCNAFDELVDAQENEGRIELSNQARNALGKPSVPQDTDFLEALRKGIKPSCGNALGFDRLLAILLAKPGLGSLIPFRSNRPYHEALRSEHLDGFS